MGIFARLATLIKSNLNDLISRSEDPEKMLNQVVIDMANQLIEAKKQVAVAIADEKRLAKQAEQEAANAAEWERRAMLAIKAGDDNLAKEALNRKKEHDQLATSYKDQWQKQKQAVDQLKTALRLLNNKIEEAKRKKNVLIARKKRAEAQKAIQETMSGLQNASAFETFERMSAKIDQIEAEAEATTELAEEYSGDTLAHRFGQLEATAGADDALLELKRKMGMAPPAEVAPQPTQPVQMRVAGTSAPTAIPQHEQDELAAAIAELEAEEQREQARLKR
ncbi:PspA/IM30 family protein [Chondromyces crocatus]|uniref:Lipid transfer protein M30-like protein n=1 Tax=Chondromyces crocatus TaxID=52 RepID=A0A0K1EEB7_CHOCO|nr:PspA/IM30 family protein [Chondromyces crocatus]AKT39210.1 lipid transfer protein M30-like protein [Chondromyces crocatus]